MSLRELFPMPTPHLIVWDLDGTLGDFHALEKHCQGDSVVKVTTRPGLASTLHALGRAGFVHSVLTMASIDYAEIALRGTGLREFFTRVEGAGQRRKGDVAGVAEAFGIPRTDLAARILFVGDRMVFDEPDDPNVVFHVEQPLSNRPAEELERLVLRLRKAGRGSFREGFRRLALAPRKWYQFRRPAPMPLEEVVRRDIDGLGPIYLLERQKECPVIAFAEPPAPLPASDEHCFVAGKVWQA